MTTRSRSTTRARRAHVPTATRTHRKGRASHPAAQPTRRRRPQPPNPATLALRRFAALLRSVKASAATLSKEQRSLLRKALRHAHAALD